MDDLSVLKHLVREDAWADVLALYPATPDQTANEVFANAVAVALSMEGDIKGVAAYLLETLCARLRREADTQTSGVQQTKSYEVVGDWKEEFFAPGETLEAKLAGTYCARAAALRGQLANRARVSANPEVVLTLWSIV